MRELTTHEIDLVAGGLDIESNYAKIHITQKVTSVGFAYGNVATAEATAVGYNGTATATNTETSPWSSSSSSVSVSTGAYYFVG